MIRVGSQMTFCSPDKILRRTVVEQNEQGVITGLFSLDDLNVESSQTFFYDGILSSEIISLKQHIPIDKISQQLNDYQYLDLTVSHSLSDFILSKKKLIIDFGPATYEYINQQLPQLTEVLSDYSIFEVIAACTYYPALLLGISGGLNLNHCTRLLLWEDVDLVNKKLTVDSSVRTITDRITN